MSNYHVHIYRLAEMAEVDLEADSPQNAMTLALAQVKELKFKEADNKYLALPFEVNGHSMGATTKTENKEEEKINYEILVKHRQFLDQLKDWTVTFGAELCPPSYCADTYGDGVREMKDVVRDMLHNLERSI